MLYWIGEVRDFFSKAGWFANLVTIATGLFALAGGLWAAFRLLRGSTKLKTLVTSEFEAKWSSLKAKSFVRVAIVDDEPGDFPVSDLKAAGFDVTVYRHATLGNSTKLATYDIIFLDMKGIVKDDPEFGGLRLIEELRRARPSQKICAVSSKTFDPTATEFFRQADDYKKKPLTAQECKSVIDSFLEDMFSWKTLLTGAQHVLNTLSRNKRKKIISEIKSFASKKTSENHLINSLESFGLGDIERSYLLNFSRAISNEAR